MYYELLKSNSHC